MQLAFDRVMSAVLQGNRKMSESSGLLDRCHEEKEKKEKEMYKFQFSIYDVRV